MNITSFPGADSMGEAMRDAIAGAGLDRPGPPVVVGITSPARGAGTTTVTLGIAQILAREAIPGGVAVVDAHLASPGIALQLGVKATPGLAEVLSGSKSLAEVARAAPDVPLDVVPAGTAIPGSSFSVMSRAGNVFAELRDRYGVVLVDLPPVSARGLGLQIAASCDSVVMVVQFGRTTVHELTKAREFLRGLPLAGVVLNNHRASTPRFVLRTTGLAD